MQWSDEQNTIFNTALTTNKSILINAVAGSGKTTTVVELASRMTSPGIFVAFNKTIAAELATKLPPNFKAYTFHSLGLKLLKESLLKVTVDTDKIKNIVHNDPLIPSNVRYLTQQIVSLAKNYGVGLFEDINDKKIWTHTIDNCTMVDVPPATDINLLIEGAIRTLNTSNEDINTIDFDDMVYMPLLLIKNDDVSFTKYNCIIVDESQDTNNIQIELLKNLTNRVIAVGDRNQAIYGFRGADYAAFDSIAGHFSADELPLTTSYRCAKNIIKDAQKFVPHIKHQDNAEEGIIHHTTIDEFMPSLNSLSSNSAIICRANAPLIQLAVRRLRAKKPFTILSDLPKKLTNIVKNSKTNDISTFISDITKKHNLTIKDLESKSLHNRANIEREKFDAITYLASESKDVQELLTLIEQLVNGKDGVILSTIHKSKGLEFDNVFFYYRDMCPAYFAIKSGNPMAIQQEDNLIYVGITRAKKELTYIYST